MSNPVPSSLALTTISGTIAASPLNTDYSAIQTAVNALITALGGGVASQVLQAVDSTHVQWAYQGGLYRKTTSKTVNNTVAETDLLNGEITIGAGVLGTTGMLRVSTFIDMLANSGGAATWRYKIKLGGTTVFDTGAQSLPNEGAPRSSMWLDFEMLNTGAANTNVCRVKSSLPITSLGTPTAPAMTIDSLAAGSWGFILGSFPTTIDTATSKLLEITVQHGTAAATIETKLYGAVAEVL